MPLIIGEDRLIPGFEEHLVGLKPGETTEFDITFPEDYQEESLRGAQAHFAVELKELREKVLPEADDEFARSMGDFADMAALRAEIRKRLERNALDRARHGFADRIIEYAVANATVDLPDILVDQEVEVMHDELRCALARQGITEEAYLKVTGKTAEELHAEFRPGAEKRAKTLLVLGEIAEPRGRRGPGRATSRPRSPRAGPATPTSPSCALLRHPSAAAGCIRSTLRRSRVVEKLIDEWLAAHPEHPAIPHVEDATEPSAVDRRRAGARRRATRSASSASPA